MSRTSGRRGQVESIGVVLLLGVVVVSVSAFGVFYLTDGFDGGRAGGATGATVNIVGDVSYDRLELSHAGGRGLSTANLRLLVRNESGTTEFPFDPARMVGGDGDESFDAGETWRFDWEQSVGEEVTVRVVDVHQNAVLYSETLTVAATPTPDPDNPARGETPTATPDDNDDDPTTPEDDESPSAVARGGTMDGWKGESLTLDGADSSDPDGDDVTYEWEIVDGDGLPPEAARLVDDAADTPNATFELRRNVTDRTHEVRVRLTVSDGDDEARDTATVTIEKVNRPPDADAGEDREMGESDDGGEDHDHDGDEDHDHDRNNLWAVAGTNGETVELDAQSVAAPRPVVEGGSPTTRQSFGDWWGGGGDDDEDGDGPVGTVELDGSRSSDPDGDDLTYEWEVVDSDGLGESVELADSSAVRPRVRLLSAVTDRDRTVTVRLTVTDDDGAADTDTVNVSVAADDGDGDGDDGDGHGGWWWWWWDDDDRWWNDDDRWWDDDDRWWNDGHGWWG